MKMRRPRWLALLLGLGLVLVGCGSNDAASSRGKPNPESSVTLAASEDTWPQQGTAEKSTTFAYPLNVNVYEPLIYLGSDYSLRPGLATSWDLVEPSTWRFHLRRGVTFHDGHPFTADDVLWTWGVRQLKGQTLSTVTSALGPDSVKKIDDFTVDFTPKEPNLRLPEQIVHPEGAIVEKGMDFDTQPYGMGGTGPFGVSSYQPGQQVVVARYDGYWGVKPAAKQLTFRFLPDPQTRIQALKAGTVDVVLDLPPDVAGSIDSDSTYHVVSSKPGRNQLIYVNKAGKAPYDLGADQAVREALSLAIDRRTYVQAAFDGNADPGRAMAPTAVLGDHADLVEPVPYDTGKAKQLLEQDGWTPGAGGIRTKAGRPLSLTLIAWAEVSDTSLQFLQAQLKDVGIDAKIKKAADQATYSNYYKSKEFDLDLEVPNQNDGNPAFLPVLRMASTSKNTELFAPGGQFDVLAQQAQAARSEDAVQKAAAQMMHELINVDDIVVPLAGVKRVYGMTNPVDLADPHPSQTNQLWVSLSKASAG